MFVEYWEYGEACWYPGGAVAERVWMGADSDLPEPSGTWLGDWCALERFLKPCPICEGGFPCAGGVPVTLSRELAV